MKMLAIVLALSLLAGCVVVPAGPHGGYHATPHYGPPPHGYSYYGHDAPRYHDRDGRDFGQYERGGYR